MITDNSHLEYMQLYDEVTDELLLTEMFIDSVVQPGNKDTFNPKGTVKFRNRKGKVKPCKVDINITPTQITALYKSYLGKIKKSKRDNVYSLLFEEEIVNLIVKRAKQDIRLKALFKGKENGEGTTPEDTMEGILRILARDFINANVYAGAPITAVNAVEQVVAVQDLVPAALSQHDLVAVMDPDVKKFYERDYQVTFGSLPYNLKYEKETINGTQTELVPEIGLAGTGAVIITPRENMCWLTDSTGKQDSIIVEKSKRNIDIMMDFDAAPEIAVMELVYMNEAALTWIENKHAGSKHVAPIVTNYWD